MGKGGWVYTEKGELDAGSRRINMNMRRE